MNLRSTIQKAGKTLKGALAPQPSDDILSALHKDHDLVQALLEKLVDSESAPERRSLLKQIQAALIPHAKAEEKVVYDRVMALKGNGAKVDAHEGYFEHQAAERMLANLAKIEQVKSPEFTAAATGNFISFVGDTPKLLKASAFDTNHKCTSFWNGKAP